jgi:hypothetical protein
MGIQAISRMRVRLAAVAIMAAVAAHLFEVAAYAADDSFLKEMPNAARVLMDIRGNNPMDTAAKTAASFTLLTRMMFARVGRRDIE